MPVFARRSRTALGKRVADSRTFCQQQTGLAKQSLVVLHHVQQIGRGKLSEKFVLLTMLQLGYIMKCSLFIRYSEK